MFYLIIRVFATSLKSFSMQNSISRECIKYYIVAEGIRSTISAIFDTASWHDVWNTLFR